MLIKANVSFDLVRLSHAKRDVDISSNTIRKYSRHGLNLYRMGKAIFFSQAELIEFIKRKSQNGGRYA
jgi:hypothetical protein